MSWFQAVSNTVLKTLLSSEAAPEKVLEVRSRTYSERIIHCREDAMVLYGPTDNKYEIVLHRPCTETLHQAFSLYRTPSLQDAELKFLLLKDKLPVLVDISHEICNITGIQKVCDMLEDHPSWTIAHIVAHMSLLNYFTHPTILSILHSSEAQVDPSPLQLAIQTGNLRAVQILVSANSSLEHLDIYKNSVFHYAARTTKDIIMLLSAKSTSTLNNQNGTGQTPLHIACLSDKPECVKALLTAGADVNISSTKSVGSPCATPPGYLAGFVQDNAKKLNDQDMKYGGTPLHWSCSREVICTLVEMGCHINGLNFNGRSALHMMVHNNRLECVVALLSHNADVDIGDKEGDTALHLAVRNGNCTIVQALVVFGANLIYRNKKGETPRHCVSTDEQGERILYVLHSVGAPRCILSMSGCTNGCIASETEHNGIPPPKPCSPESRQILDQMLTVFGMSKAAFKKQIKNAPRGGRVLCLDGGGIRGLVLIQLLLALEKETGSPIIHSFDWLAGTSTGGILALGLASGKTLKECFNLYFCLKDKVFVGSRPYNSDPLDAILKETFRGDTVMSDIKHPKLVITAVLADRKPVTLHLFRNYESPSALMKADEHCNAEPMNAAMFKPPPRPHEQLLWRAARATGAAPSFFKGFGRYLDGGLIANNPTLDVLTELHEYNVALEACGRGTEVCPPTVVVSLGTGVIPVSQMKEIEVFRPESLWDAARFAVGISALATLLVDQATASDGRVVDRARTWCSMIGVPYFRFSPQLSEDIGLDERNDEKLIKMMWESKAYMHTHRCSVQELATILSANCTV